MAPQLKRDPLGSATEDMFASPWLVSLFISGPVCTMVSVPATRSPTLTYFIATALPDTLQAKAGKGPTQYGTEIMSASTPPGLRPPPSADTPVFGQVVSIERIKGNGADAIAERITRGERKALLIPWAYQANCSPVLWARSARWNEPGSVGLFSAQLRPESEWVGGLPTFDVGAAWHQPYPSGEFLKYDRQRGDRSLRELNVNELFDLYQVLPTPDSLESVGSVAIQPARAWARAHPDQAKRWPATRILDMLEFLAKPENR